MAYIRGTQKNDYLRGTNDDDVIMARDGNDMILASPGWDSIDGGKGSDTVDYSAVSNDLSIVLKGGMKTQAHFDGVYMDTLVNIENLIGGSGDDYFVGDKSNNIFTGNAGHDYFVASCGFDKYYGGTGYDTVDFSAVNTGLKIIPVGRGVMTVTAGSTVYDHLVSIENIVGGSKSDTIIGDGADNYFRGNAGNDKLMGGAGGDVLDGGLGNDTLTGGADADTFYFGNGYGKDTVTDFQAHGASHDVIQLGPDLGITTVEEVAHLASQKGNDVVVDFGDGDMLILKNVDLDHLDASHVTFL